MEYEIWLRHLAKESSNDLIGPEIAKVRGTPPTNEEIETRRRVYRYLSALETLRIVVEDALNFGHQAAAATLAESLAELGYQNTFTFLAPANIRDKITQVLPERLRERVKVLEVPEYNLEQVYSEPVVDGPCELAMAGADDRLDGDEATSANFLGYTGAANAIVLKPYAWGSSARRMFRRGRKPVELDQIPPDAVYRYHTSSPSDPLGVDLPGNLAAVLTAAAGGQIVLVPMYGLHRLEDYSRAAVYANAVAAIRAAYRDKPVVILEIGTTRVPYAPPPPDLRSLDINDGTLPDALGHLEPGGVLAVTIPGVAQDVFREIYRTGAGIRFLEGANTANYIMLLGLPYLTPRTTDTPYPDIGGLASVKEKLETATEALNTSTEWTTELPSNEVYSGQLKPAEAALGAVNSDVRIPRASNEPTLNIDTYLRLKKVPEVDLKAIAGKDAVQQADAMIAPYQEKIMRGATPEPPDALRLDGTRLEALRHALNVLIAKYGSTIAAQLEHRSHEPKGAAVSEVASVLRSAMTSGDPVRQYFEQAKAQATDYRYDQVLQALDLLVRG